MARTLAGRRQRAQTRAEREMSFGVASARRRFLSFPRGAWEREAGADPFILSAVSRHFPQVFPVARPPGLGWTARLTDVSSTRSGSEMRFLRSPPSPPCRGKGGIAPAVTGRGPQEEDV